MLGQYDNYVEELGEASTTETYVAMKLAIITGDGQAFLSISELAKN